jgi:N-acetylmuramoyl-L-alanine amidase
MPALLLENLFIDSPRDAQALKDADFLRDAARAIAAGIAAAFGLERKLTGMERLKRAGLVLGEHAPEDAVTWDEFQTVMNRLLDRCESCRQQGGCGA